MHFSITYLLRAKRHYWMTLIIAIFLAAVKLLGIVLLPRLSQNLSASDTASAVFQSDARRPVRIFMEDSVHFRVTGDDAEWEAMVPGQGIVYLGDANAKKPYTLSMFHQLRCLDIIRKAVVDLEGRVSEGSFNPKTGLTDLTHHCVNYLRQMVLCRSDLEVDTVYGKPKPAVFPDAYQCKDWEAIYRDVEKNQEGYDSSKNNQRF